MTVNGDFIPLAWEFLVLCIADFPGLVSTFTPLGSIWINSVDLIIIHVVDIYALDAEFFFDFGIRGYLRRVKEIIVVRDGLVFSFASCPDVFWLGDVGGGCGCY